MNAPLIASVSLSLALVLTSVIKTQLYQMDCGGYLIRASNAATVEVAKKQLDTALTYCSKNGITHGSTAILWTRPEHDVGYWYDNLKQASDELGMVRPDASQLEKSNLLLKLRETLMDGSAINDPPNIEFFPYNKLGALLVLLSSLAVVATVIPAVNNCLDPPSGSTRFYH